MLINLYSSKTVYIKIIIHSDIISNTQLIKSYADSNKTYLNSQHPHNNRNLLQKHNTILVTKTKHYFNELSIICRYITNICLGYQ